MEEEAFWARISQRSADLMSQCHNCVNDHMGCIKVRFRQYNDSSAVRNFLMSKSFAAQNLDNVRTDNKYDKVDEDNN